MLTPHAYLAGPDVFLPNAVDIGARKIAALKAVGIVGHFPLDNQLDLPDDPQKASFLIGQANERMMLDCCREDRFGIILANMMPYHGPSMDVGSSFEIGFMSALAETRKNILIVGYTDDPRSFEGRVIEMIHGGRQNIREQNGLLYAQDGTLIEAFAGVENLMITHAIEKTGGCIASNFEEAVAIAKTVLSKAERV